VSDLVSNLRVRDIKVKEDEQKSNPKVCCKNTVLIVEDEQFCAFALKAMLQGFGLSSDLAFNG